jgi:hypothetical protein
MPGTPTPLVISRIMVEPPGGWGPRRMLITRLRALGYAVEEHIVAGVSVLVITGTRAGASRPGTLTGGVSQRAVTKPARARIRRGECWQAVPVSQRDAGTQGHARTNRTRHPAI